MHARRVDKARTSRGARRPCGRFFVLCGAAAFVMALAAVLLELAYWNARLALDSARRAAARYSTVDAARVDDSSSLLSTLSQAEARSGLRGAADAYRRSRNDDAAAAEAVDAGLARWGLADAADKFDFMALRVADNRASQSALDVLSTLEPDPDVAQAVAFLTELDGESIDSSAEYELWAFDVGAANPLDSLGVVASSDFGPSPTVQFARRIADASARLFLFLTLGVFLLGPRSGASLTAELLRAFFTRALCVWRQPPTVCGRLRCRAPYPKTARPSLTALSSVRLLI
jgi:hypothetical protein